MRGELAFIDLSSVDIADAKWHHGTADPRMDDQSATQAPGCPSDIRNKTLQAHLKVYRGMVESYSKALQQSKQTIQSLDDVLVRSLQGLESQSKRLRTQDRRLATTKSELQQAQAALRQAGGRISELEDTLDAIEADTARPIHDYNLLAAHLKETKKKLLATSRSRETYKRLTQDLAAALESQTNNLKIASLLSGRLRDWQSHMLMHLEDSLSRGVEPARAVLVDWTSIAEEGFELIETDVDSETIDNLLREVSLRVAEEATSEKFGLGESGEGSEEG